MYFVCPKMAACTTEVLSPLSAYVLSICFTSRYTDFFRYYHVNWTSHEVFDSLRELYAGSLVINGTFMNMLREWHKVEDVDIKHHIYAYLCEHHAGMAGEYVVFARIKLNSSRCRKAQLRYLEISKESRSGSLDDLSSIKSSEDSVCISNSNSGSQILSARSSEILIVPDTTPTLNIPILHLLYRKRDFAAKLTAYIRGMYRSITTKELLGKHSTLPRTVKAYINFTNNLNDHITWEIIFNNDSDAQRDKKIKYYLNVCKRLHKTCNYEGLQMISTSLNHSRVVKHMSTSNRALLTKYNTLFCRNHNFRNYVTEVSSLPSYIPMFMLILMRITSIREIPAYAENNNIRVVNESKLDAVAKIMAPFVSLNALPAEHVDMHLTVDMENIVIYNRDIMALDLDIAAILPNYSSTYTRQLNVYNTDKSTLSKIATMSPVTDVINFAVSGQGTTTVVEFNFKHWVIAHTVQETVSTYDGDDFMGYVVVHTVASKYFFARHDPVDVGHQDRGRWFIQLYNTKLQHWTKYDVVLWAMHHEYSPECIDMLRQSTIDGNVLCDGSTAAYIKCGVTDEHYIKRLQANIISFQADVAFHDDPLKYQSYRNILSWSCYDMAAWLEESHMDGLVKYFITNNITGRHLVYGGLGNCETWGVTSPGDLMCFKRLYRYNTA